MMQSIIITKYGVNNHILDKFTNSYKQKEVPLLSNHTSHNTQINYNRYEACHWLTYILLSQPATINFEES